MTGFVCRFSEVLDNAREFIIDIPRLWDYLAEMVEPIFKDGIADPNFLSEIRLFLST